MEKRHTSKIDKCLNIFEPQSSPLQQRFFHFLEKTAWRATRGEQESWSNCIGSWAESRVYCSVSPMKNCAAIYAEQLAHLQQDPSPNDFSCKPLVVFSWTQTAIKKKYHRSKNFLQYSTVISFFFVDDRKVDFLRYRRAIIGNNVLEEIPRSVNCPQAAAEQEEEVCGTLVFRGCIA